MNEETNEVIENAVSKASKVEELATKIVERTAKLEKRVTSLRKSLKKCRDEIISYLPDATDEELEVIKQDLSAYSSSAYELVNKQFKLTDVQVGELELHLIDVEDSLNTDEGKAMIEESFKNAKRIKRFSIGKVRKKDNMIPVSCSWEVSAK